MRIAYYNPHVNEPWGSGIHGRSLVGGWQDAGNEVLSVPAVLGPDGAPASIVGRYSRIPDLVKVPARDVRARLRHWRSAESVIRTIDAFGPDVLVVRRHAYDYVADALVAQARTPVVAEVNAVASTEASAHLGETILPWEARRERAYLGRCDRIVCVTHDVAAQVKQAGVKPREIVVVGNGVDVGRFSPEVTPSAELTGWASQHEIVVGYCGKAGGLHDLETMVAAARRVLERTPETGFLFIGPSMDDLRDAGWSGEDPGAVLATGRLTHSRVPGAMKCADILWASFNNIYGSPLKLYEYMAMGIPFVLGMEGAAVADALACGGGIVVPRRAPDKLADEVIRLGDLGAENRTEMGSAARSWAIDNASWTSIASAMVRGLGRQA